MSTQLQWIEYRTPSGVYQRKSSGEFEVSSDRPLKRSRGEVSTIPVFTPPQPKKRKTTTERPPEEVFADIFSSQHLFRSPSPQAQSPSQPPPSRTVDSHTLPATSTTHTLRSPSPSLDYAFKPLRYSIAQRQRSLLRNPKTQLSENEDIVDILSKTDELIAREKVRTLHLPTSDAPVPSLQNPTQLPSLLDSTEDTECADSEEYVRPAPEPSAEHGPSEDPPHESMNSTSFVTAASSLDDFHNVSLLASTPKSPVRDIDPSMLLLRSVEADIGHIDEELLDFNALFSRGGCDILESTTTESNKSIQAPSSQLAHLRGDSIRVGKTTHTVSIVPSANSRKDIPRKKEPQQENLPRAVGTKKKRKATTKKTNSTHKKINTSTHNTPPSDSTENLFVPLRIHAERGSPTGLELFIEWEDYPLPEDWTWEFESELDKSVPELIQAWRTSQDGRSSGGSTKTEEVFIIEKILDRRNMKGVLHYLVKWKGYDKLGDRTWEPAGNLEIDVPGVVEEFEKRRGEKKRRGVRKRKVKREKV